MTIQTMARNATLTDIAELLRLQSDSKLDAVVPATAIHSECGILHIDGVHQEVPDTVEAFMAGEAAVSAASFAPTDIADAHIADKLGIPLVYMRRLRAERPDMYDANVNGWLHGSADADGDTRRFLARCFVDPDGGVGVCRALLSDSYRRIDNLDVLTAALDGVRDAGLNVTIDSCDLSEKRMVVKMIAPEVQALAPTLLANYRSPFSGESGRDLPVVWAGLVISNSETGGGAYSIVPRMVVEVCKNGMTRTADAVRSVHLGAKLDEGVVRWSTATEERSLDLVRSQTSDAVRSFLDVEYMQRVIGEIESKSGTPLSNPVEQVRVVAQRMRYPQATLDGLLDHFVRACDATVGGVFQAVTSLSQTLADPDAAYDLECSAFDALDAAALVAAGR